MLYDLINRDASDINIAHSFWLNVTGKLLGDLGEFRVLLQIELELNSTGETQTKAEDTVPKKPSLIIDPSTNRISYKDKTSTYSERIVKALCYALNFHKGYKEKPGKKYFDRREICDHLEINPGTVIRDIILKDPTFYPKEKKDRIIKKGEGKNKYYLDIDIENSRIIR